MGPCGLYQGTRKICTLVLLTNLARSASWALHLAWLCLYWGRRLTRCTRFQEPSCCLCVSFFFIQIWQYSLPLCTHSLVLDPWRHSWWWNWNVGGATRLFSSPEVFPQSNSSRYYSARCPFNWGTGGWFPSILPKDRQYNVIRFIQILLCQQVCQSSRARDHILIVPLNVLESACVRDRGQRGGMLTGRR